MDCLKIYVSNREAHLRLCFAGAWICFLNMMATLKSDPASANEISTPPAQDDEEEVLDIVPIKDGV
jgi:hypothetical protein